MLVYVSAQCIFKQDQNCQSINFDVMQCMLGVLPCEGYWYITKHSMYKSVKWLMLHITELRNDVIVTSKEIINKMKLGPHVN